MRRNFICILLFLSYTLPAQQYYDDARARFSLYVEKKITKRFFISLTQQNRLNQNMTQYERASLDLGVAYKIRDFVKIEANYTYIQSLRSSGYFVPRHWFSGAVVLRGELRHFKFLYRNLFQARYKEPNTSEDAYLPRLYDRNKLTVKYQATKRIDFYVAEEIYIPLNNPLVKAIDRSRSIIGTDIKTFRDQELELYFMYEVQLQQANWYNKRPKYPDPYLFRNFIYGIAYNISF